MFTRWLRIGQSEHEPDAERRDRGTLTFKPGGTGVADVLRLLRKNASDTYERVTLATLDDVGSDLTVADTTSIDLTLASDVLRADAIFGTTSGTVAEGDHTHSQLHDPVTVTDTASIDLTLTGQNVKADAKFGTTSTTIAQGNHTHSLLHSPVTVLDTASIDLTLSGQQVSASVLPGGVSHNSLAGLTTGDPHTQYVKKAGDTITGDLTVRHRLAGGASPALTVGSAAGSGASVSVAGSDDGFRIVLITGGSGLGIGTLLTVTFATARASTEYAVSLTAGDSDAATAATLVYAEYTTRTTGGFELKTTAALPASRSHIWFVTIVEAL